MQPFLNDHLIKKMMNDIQKANEISSEFEVNKEIYRQMYEDNK